MNLRALLSITHDTLRVVESRGVVHIYVVSPKGDVLVARDGKWREGFETGPWVEEITRLLAEAEPEQSRAELRRQAEKQWATEAFEGKDRG